MGLREDVRLVTEWAREKYGADVRVELAGNLKHRVFVVKGTGGAKVVKLADEGENARIEKEGALLGVLGGKGIPTPVVEERGELEGRALLVMPVVSGVPLANFAQKSDATAVRLFGEMGTILGRVHGIDGNALDVGELAPMGRGQIVAKVHETADRARGEGLLAGDEVERFKRLPMAGIEGTSLCHGDFHAVHCLVAGERIEAVIDWEAAWVGNPLVDLAVTHAYLNYSCAVENVRAFLEGYARVREIPGAYEQEYLPARMAHALNLARTLVLRREVAEAKRAAELFRVYLRNHPG